MPGQKVEEEGIRIRDLTVRAGERLLLEGASADFPAGEVTLVIGASGAGKTVLMKILAGLIRPGERNFEVSGSISISGAAILDDGTHAAGTKRKASPPTGIVFQNAALFDEFSASENLRFARDHRSRHHWPSTPPSEGDDARIDLAPNALLEEFGLPGRVPISVMSGGQKQRLAIARTLAYDPPVIIYDEPTAGLDAANALHVASRIEDTGKAHGKTSLVVTHDYEHLAGIASTFYLLDPEKRALVRLSRDELDALSTCLPGATSYQEGAEVTRKPPLHRFGKGVLNILEGTGAVLEKSLLSILFLLPLWRSIRWGLRYLVHYLSLVASPSSCLYFASSGIIAGFVSTHFVFKFLPHKKYTEPLISDELLNGLGFALYRIVVPVLLTILLAARCGAAVASDVGNRVYGHQVDAMRSLGARPSRYLLTGILYAFLLGTPILVGVGFLSARYTSLAVYAYNYPDKGPDYWDGNFHRDLRIPGQVLYRGTPWLLAKILSCGLGVGIIAFHIGLREKTSGVEVSRGITSTIIWGTLFVLLMHFLFAFFEF